jgi:hypothetical protein
MTVTVPAAFCELARAQVHLGKVSGSAKGAAMLPHESWIPSRALVSHDERFDRPKIMILEFHAVSDPKRRLHLGLHQLCVLVMFDFATGAESACINCASW